MQEQTIPQGYKKTEIGIIPEDWEVKKLGEIALNIGTGIKNNEDKIENGKYPFFVRSDKVERINTYSYDCEAIIVPGEGNIGEIFHYIKGKFDAHQRVYVIRNFEKVYVKYVFYYMKQFFGKHALKNSVKATVDSLRLPTFLEFEISLPTTISEQQAIARVLSDVDRLIESLDKLIEKKKMMKKGAMQELLTGKRRLPGFTGEWVKKKLGEIAEIKKGDLITEKTAKKGDIPVIGGGIEPTYYHNKSNRGPNTITISASGANAGYVNFYPYPIFASDCSTIEENNNYDVKFLYHFLKLKQNDIIKLQTGGAQPHVYPEQLKNLMIYFPPTLEEQQAIAQILSDMDAEIEALEKKKEKYEMIKKGAMELLLTGKVRLKNKIN